MTGYTKRAQDQKLENGPRKDVGLGQAKLTPWSVRVMCGNWLATKVAK